MNLSDILSTIDEEIARLEQARSLLQGSSTSTHAAAGAKRRGRPAGTAAKKLIPEKPEKKTRSMSDEGRARIAAAQKARWAAKKKAAKPAAPATVAKKAPSKKAAAPAKPVVARNAAPARPAVKRSPSAKKRAAKRVGTSLLKPTQPDAPEARVAEAAEAGAAVGE